MNFRSRLRLGRLLLLAPLPLLVGCLNLCGRTTNIQEDPQTKTRLASLEYRVRQLEQQREVVCTTPAEAAAP